MENNKFVTLHTEQMDFYPALTEKALGIAHGAALNQLEELKETEKSLLEGYYFALVSEVIEQNYDFGNVIELYKVYGGYANTTLAVYTMKDGVRQTWLVRMYRKGKDLDGLLFEHKLLIHAKKNGFTFCATPQPTKNGLTYCQHEVNIDGIPFDYYFAIFNYVDGDVLYDWIPNWAEENLNEVTIVTAARDMAELHSSTVDYDAEGRHGDNIMDSEDASANDLIKKFPNTLRGYRKTYSDMGWDGNAFTDFFDSVLPVFDKACPMSYIPPEAYSQMQINPCHCDFHAGNFKYLPDGTICGSFDYDMAKFDSRLFEIGCAMHYLFGSWKIKTDGVLRMDRIGRFVGYYNQFCTEIGRIPPLSDLEKSYFFEALVQGTIYVYGWATSYIAGHQDVDPYEYLYYCRHIATSLNWVLDHEEEIREFSKTL